MSNGSGTYLLIAFVIGFWGIWSASREPNSLMEGLTITIIAIVAKAIMEWSGIPEINNVMLASWGILWVCTVVILELVGRYSVSTGVNLTISVGGAVAWFFLAQYIFGPEGVKMVQGWVG